MIIPSTPASLLHTPVQVGMSKKVTQHRKRLFMGGNNVYDSWIFGAHDLYSFRVFLS